MKIYNLSAITAALLLLISLVEVVVVSRYVGPDIYGVYSLLVLVISLIGLAGNGVLYQVSLRSRSEFCRFELLELGLILLQIFLIVFFSVLAKLYDLVGIGALEILLMVLIIVLKLVSSNIQPKLLIRSTKVLNWAQLLSSVFSVISTVCALTIVPDKGVLSLLFGVVVREAIFFCICIVNVPFKVNVAWSRFRRTRSLLKQYRLVWFANWVGFVASSYDKWLILILFGQSSLGIYSRLVQLINVATAIPSKIITQEYQAALRLNERRKTEHAIKIVIYLSIIGSSFVFFVGEDLTLFLLGSAWVETAALIGVASLLIVFKVLLKIMDVFIRTRCAPFDYLLLQIFSALPALFMLLGGWWFGLYEAIVAQLIGVIILVFFLFQRYCNLRVSDLS